MFGGSLFGGMDDDPFFRSHMNMMSEMQRSMGLMQGGMFGPGLSAFPGMAQPQAIQPASRGGGSHAAVARHGAMGDPFQQMFSSMTRNMNAMMPMGMHGMQPAGPSVTNNPNGAFYSHSSVMSYSNTGQGPPKIVQSSSSTTQAPGGVRETKNSLRDSEQGIEKLSVGRHIGDRSHVIQRQRNVRSGDQEEEQEYVNLEEEQAEAFNQEFQQRTHSFHPQRSHGHRAVRDAVNPGHRGAARDGRARYEGAHPSSSRPRHHHEGGDGGPRRGGPPLAIQYEPVREQRH